MLRRQPTLHDTPQGRRRSIGEYPGAGIGGFPHRARRDPQSSSSTRPSLIATRIKLTRLSTSSLAMRLVRWCSTVLTLMCSAGADRPVREALGDEVEHFQLAFAQGLN